MPTTTTTTTTEAPIAITLTAKTLGFKSNEIAALRTWLTKTRTEQCADALHRWIMVGDICTRIKSSKIDGKFSENVQAILGCELTNDERQYSMKLYDAEKTVTEWYMTTGCMKYNPRTIWTAYASKDEKELPPEEKKALDKQKKAEKEEKTLRKERTGEDAVRALIEFRKIRDNAAENGNLLLKDLEILKNCLESELKAITDLYELEKA